MFLYNASALGLAGSISRPFRQVLENQASTSLGTIGGIGRAEVKDFEFNGIVSFRRAFAETSGSFESDTKTHNTSARVTVEGLNVLDVISADRLVVRLSGRYREGESEPQILAAGTHFENLRVLGEPVNIELKTRFFDENDTFRKFEEAYPRLREDLFRNKPPFDVTGQRSYSVSLIENVSLQSDVKLRRHGSVIEVADFGRIYLAEFLIQPSRRQLNMLRVELGSPIAGSLLIASASCNGLGGDSGKDDD